MSRLLKNEQPHHLKAFECYFGLGDKRSFARVASEMGVNLNTAKLWSRSFGWKRRIAEREAEVLHQVTQRTISDAVAENERNLKMIRMAKLRVMKDIHDGRAKSAVGDLPKLILLERELVSLPDSPAPLGRAPRMGSGVVIYLPDNGRDPNTAAVDITNPRHPHYRKPATPDSSDED